MARPKKPPESRFDVDLRIRITKEQQRVIKEAAELDQAETSTWARTILFQAAQDRISKGRSPNSARTKA